MLDQGRGSYSGDKEEADSRRNKLVTEIWGFDIMNNSFEPHYVYLDGFLSIQAISYLILEIEREA